MQSININHQNLNVEVKTIFLFQMIAASIFNGGARARRHKSDEFGNLNGPSGQVFHYSPMCWSKMYSNASFQI